MALVLPRLLAPVFPTTYSPRDLVLKKADTMYQHLGSPYHTFVYCKGFAPAALRRARASVPVPFSGLPLSRPLLIFGLVGHYPTNNLISRRLIFRHRNFQERMFQYLSLSGISLSFPRLFDLKADYRRVTEHYAGSPKTP